MQESKIAITERLRADGRWQEASIYKDQVVKQLRAEGKPAKEARELAWCEMANKYPVEMTASTQTKASDFEGMDSKQITKLADAPLDPAADVLWCYRHVENPIVKVTDAPSLGAWGLLKYARTNRQRFYEHLLPTALATHKPDDLAGGQQDPALESDTDHMPELERFLRQAEG